MTGRLPTGVTAERSDWQLDVDADLWRERLPEIAPTDYMAIGTTGVGSSYSNWGKEDPGPAFRMTFHCTSDKNQGYGN